MNNSTKNKAILRRFPRVFSFFLYIINIAFSFVFLGLLIFLACLYFNVKIVLSKEAEDFLKAELKKEGLVLDANAISFDFAGNIIIEEAKLGFLATASDFFSARYLAFKLSFKDLFLGDLGLEYLFVKNAVLSPVNVDKDDLSLISDISFVLHNKNNKLLLRNFKADLGGLNINIKGSFDKCFFANPPEDKREKKTEVLEREALIESYLSSLENISTKLNNAKNYADKLNYPNLSIEFEVSEDGLKEVYCLFRAKDLDLKIAEHSISLSNLKLALRLDSQTINNKEAEVFTSLIDFKLDDFLEARQLNLNTKISIDDFNDIASFSFKDFKFRLNDLYLDKHKIDHLSIDASEVPLEKTPESLDLYIKRGDSYIDTVVKVSKNSIILDFDYLDNPEIFLEIPALAKLKDTKVIGHLDINKAISIRGQANLSFLNAIDTWDILGGDFSDFEELDDVQINAFLYAKDINFAKENVAEVYGRIDFNLSEARVSDIYLLSSDGWSIGGEFYQGIESPDYIFQLGGRFEPSCLNGVMAPWWDMIFSKLELLTYPYVDVFVNGKWGDPAFTWVYAKIEAEKLKYNDYAFEDISLQLNVNPSIICAYDVELKGANGYADAYLAWVYDPSVGLKKYLYRNIRGFVDMQYDGIKALGGEDVEDIVDIVSFEDNIKLNLDLYDINPRRDPNFEQRVSFDVESENPIKVSYFNFDSIKARGNAVGNSFSIKDATAKFFDGDLAGDFSMRKIDDKNYFNAKLEATSLNQGKLLDLILEISDTKTEEPISESNYLGRLDSEIEAEGFLLDFDSYKAKANITIENPELQKVSILGGVSRALEAFRIPLTTLEFTSIKSDFTLENANLFFPNLEIRSTTSNLFGKAIYTATTDEVSARMYFNWRTAGRVPILGHIADFAFDPILDSILLVVSDTFSSPNFSARIRPLNIFNSEQTMLDNIDIEDL